MKSVIIVDDNESVAASLAIALAGMPNIEAIITHHPVRALQLFSTGQYEGTIAAIVTDFNLPQLNGLELIKQVRSIKGYERLPAIMITAEENLTDANDCMLNAPNAIFRKPFSMKEVCRVLQDLLA